MRFLVSDHYYGILEGDVLCTISMQAVQVSSQ